MAKEKTTKRNNTDKLSFEQAIENLTEIVDKIETGQVSLAESLFQYEKGMDLIRHCRNILLDAEKRIEKITNEEKGESETDDDVDKSDGSDDDVEDDDESLF